MFKLKHKTYIFEVTTFQNEKCKFIIKSKEDRALDVLIKYLVWSEIGFTEIVSTSTDDLIGLKLKRYKICDYDELYRTNRA